MSEIIIFSRDYRDCNCPCHRGIKGRFHCWSDCCEFPNKVLSNKDLPDAVKRALQATLDYPTN